MEEFLQHFLEVVRTCVEWSLVRIADWFISHFLG